MKRVIRRCVFETNSSMGHSLSILPIEDFQKYKDGKLAYCPEDDKFYPFKEIIFPDDDRYWDENYELKDGEFFPDDVWLYGEWYKKLTHYEHEFTTPSGDKMVAFGEFGMCC